MRNVRWRKIVRDLWLNRARTTLVVVSIAVGIFAVGTVQLLRSVILTELQAIYDASNASQANLFVDGVDEETLRAVRRIPTVAEAEGRSTLSVKVEVAPDEWQNLTVTAIEDFENIRVNVINPLSSVDAAPDFGAERTAWPQRNEIILERSGLGDPSVLPAGLQVGDELRVRTVDDRDRTVRVSGAVFDPNGFSARFTGSASGYIDYDTFERLGGVRAYDQIILRVAGTPEQQLDKEYITSVANEAADKIERAGFSVRRVQVPDPGRLALQDLFDALALLLTPLGLLALLLSGFLVINTMSALMAQQVRQIGVMKAIGARRAQIVGMYLGAVLIYSVAALAVAVPLTVVVAGGLAGFLGGFINVEFPRWSLPLNVIIIQLAVGILAPLLAALVPVWRGAAITVREAVTDYGVSAQDGGDGRFMRLLKSIKGLSRPMQLSLRNTFRRRARLVLTLLTLVLGGMIFMTVGSVRSSLDGLINTGLSYYQFDVQVQFGQPYRTARIEQVVRAIPAFTTAEGWLGAQALRVRDDGTKGNPLTVTALEADSAMVSPTLSQGRWLLPDDQNAIVLSQNVLGSETDIEVGDAILLEINGKESPWVVVGIAQVLGGPPNVIPVYVNYPYFSWLTTSVNRATSLQLKLDPEAGLTQDEAATLLNERLEAAGFAVSSVFTIDTLRRFTGAFFDIIVYLLLAMGVLIASVGALGLAGTMSTNVLERTREIGVMRAIGASDGSVLRIVIVEGLFIGLISWFLGALLAYPAGLALAQTVGVVLFQQSLPYVFSAGGLGMWFVIVVVLATMASFLPAWRASQLTVREVLAYQ
ncbi:MAG: FtsX-like permease family protein [Caldilinea sp.]